jgi:hypothetical protein
VIKTIFELASGAAALWFASPCDVDLREALGCSKPNRPAPVFAKPGAQ